MTRDLPLATAVVDLTPAHPVPMGGFHGPERLTRRACGVLEANVLALGEGDDAVVLVAVDTLFAGAELTARVIEACRARFGTGPERVLILASHTHFAPMLDADKPALGHCDQVELARWVDGIGGALQTTLPGRATHVREGLGWSDAAVNRRLRWPWPTAIRLLGKKRGEIYMSDNPSGPRDPRIRTKVWLSKEGRALAALWSFSCHPVFFPERDASSPDYIGVVREALRRQLGDPQLPVIFAPGCMGDVWPRSPPHRLSIRRALQFALYGPVPAPYKPADWQVWAGLLADAVSAVDAAGALAPLGASVSEARMASLPLRRLMEGEVGDRVLTAKAVRAPGLGQVVALSCEPVSEIADLVGGSETMVLGYEGDVFGYLPTSAMAVEGGYESTGSHPYFGLSGEFRSGLDEEIADLSRRLRPEI